MVWVRGGFKSGLSATLQAFSFSDEANNFLILFILNILSFEFDVHDTAKKTRVVREHRGGGGNDVTDETRALEKTKVPWPIQRHEVKSTHERLRVCTADSPNLLQNCMQIECKDG